MSSIIVQHEDLKQLVIRKLSDAGLKEHHGKIVADVLVHADLRGVSSHGVLRTEHYVKRIKAGGINPDADFTVEETGLCSAIFNGDDGMGHVVAKEAMDHAIQMAKRNGIGMLTVINSSHCGALSYFVQQAAERNMIGIAMTHTDTIVVPFGGATPFFGTNPIAYGIPAKVNKPVILDMATSNVALGKILHAREDGKTIPGDWGVDEKGNPTTDPHQVAALSPFAGAKGYGMAMVVDIFSGLLAGAGFGPHISKMYGDYDKARKLGHFICAINPSVFTNLDSFLSNMDQMINEIHDIEPAPGFAKVLVPGEPEQLREQAQLKDGISIPQSIYQYLVSK